MLWMVHICLEFYQSWKMKIEPPHIYQCLVHCILPGRLYGGIPLKNLSHACEYIHHLKLNCNHLTAIDTRIGCHYHETPSKGLREGDFVFCTEYRIASRGCDANPTAMVTTTRIISDYQQNPFILVIVARVRGS